MRKTAHRPQQTKRFRGQPGYKEVRVRDLRGRSVRRWVRRTPLVEATMPQPGFRDPNPFWLFFINGFERGRLRKEIAQEASRIFVEEAIRIGTIPATKTAADVPENDLERLADEVEEFMQSIADAQLGFETKESYHDNFEWLVGFGGNDWALARIGHPLAYEDYPDPDPRRTLIATAQSHRFIPPYVDGDGNVRLFYDGDEPPATPADVIGIHIAGAVAGTAL